MLLINEEQATPREIEILQKEAKGILGKQRWPQAEVTFRVGQKYETIDVKGNKHLATKINIKASTVINIEALGRGSVQMRYATNVNPREVSGKIMNEYSPNYIEINGGQKKIHAQTDKDLLIFLILHQGYGIHRQIYIPDTVGEAKRRTEQFEIQNRFDNLILSGMSVDDMRTVLSHIPGHELMQRDELIQEVRSIYGVRPQEFLKMVEDGKLDSLNYISKGLMFDILEYDSKEKSFKFSDSDDVVFKAKGSKAKDEFNEFLRKPQHEKVYRELKRAVVAYEKGVEKSSLEEGEENLGAEEDTTSPFKGMKSIDIPEDKKLWEDWSQEIADEIRREGKDYNIKGAHLMKIDKLIVKIAEEKNRSSED